MTYPIDTCLHYYCLQMFTHKSLSSFNKNPLKKIGHWNNCKYNSPPLLPPAHTTTRIFLWLVPECPGKEGLAFWYPQFATEEQLTITIRLWILLLQQGTTSGADLASRFSQKKMFKDYIESYIEKPVLQEWKLHTRSLFRNYRVIKIHRLFQFRKLENYIHGHRIRIT